MKLLKDLERRLRALEPRRQKFLLALAWILLGSVLWVWWDERTMPDLQGTWASAGCEEVPASAGGASYLKRAYVFTEDHWRLDLRFHEDSACARESFGIDVEGGYELGPKLMEPRTATEARFSIERVRLTPRHIDAAVAFGEAFCGAEPWVVGQGQDISRTGCLGIPSVDECPMEYDIVSVRRGMLWHGDRSQGLCDPLRLPTTFGPHPVSRNP